MVEKLRYKLRGKDFIPIKGLLKYHSRDMDDIIENSVISHSQIKYIIREVGLIAYNVSVIYLAQSLFFSGLEKLIN